MAQMVALFWCLLGRWLDSKGLDGVAETCYRFAGNEGGKNGSEALLRLGKKLTANGALQEALKAYQESVRSDPTNANAWCALGAAYRHSTQLQESRRCYDRALEIDPSNLHALTNIGELHLAKGDPGAALGYFERVLDEAPMFYEALGNRIAALIECDKLIEAEQAAKQAIEHYPDSAPLQVNLGIVLVRSGKERLGLIAYKRALEIEPDNQEAILNLAILQNNTKALKDSVEFIRRRIELKGESADLQRLLATALKSNEQMAEAEAAYRKLLENHPTDASGWMALAICVSARGDPAQGIEYYKIALDLQPSGDVICSNMVFDSTYLPDLTPEAVFKRHLEWAERYETPLLEKQFRHLPGKEAENRLKIGYMSGDFCNHPVGNLLRGVLQQHDHSKFEIHCFSTSDVSDEFTGILRANSDCWHEVQLMSLEELAYLIKAQGIDILVDLSGHTALNRLLVFALKPAPIQATWIGYFHSTGLKSIDYFITDLYTTPRQSKQLFSEIPARLPHSRFCYTAHEFAPEVSEPPFDKTGYVTFGSFNRLAKLTNPVIEAWSRIVMKVPDAKLMIKAHGISDAKTAERLKRRFEACGLSPERLILRPSSSGHFQILQEYSEVDIALDPFPFNGGMTTLESLWMGVPVVALAGNSVVSRQSASVLTNIGHDELIFRDVESYIAGAVALALDTRRVASFRGMIRRQMSRSPLCDAEQFTQNIEMLYRRMWQAWCRGEKLGPEIVSGGPVTRKTLLHVGCGQADIRHLPAYFQKRWKEIRLDIDPDAHPDILGSALDMSAVPSHSVDAVYSSHTLEHLYAHELPLALAEMLRVLKPDGILVATVPDLQAAARMIAEDRLFETAYQSPAGPITPYDMVYSYRAFVSRDRPYMAHYGGFTLSTLIDALKGAGFAAVTGKRRESAFDLWVLSVPEPMADDQLKQLSAAVLPN
ncbi:MAG: tetratricopeptide repeat protein [Betaproteobacteria bacterium]|nr:tetratricopeptide repeat protein [Betaproteobacteria bacterium]